MTDMVYYYDGSFEGFLCCVFDSYANKEVLTAIYRDEDLVPTLFASRTILTDRDHDNEKVLELTVPAGETDLVLDLRLHSSMLLLLESC